MSLVDGGDFNVVLSFNECLCTSSPILPYHKFANMISNCGLCYSSFIVSIYTWCHPILTQNRRNLLHISKIKDDSGSILDSQDDIENETVRFFSYPFTDDSSSHLGSPSSILDYVPSLVTQSDNISLDKLSSLEEVK